jgi:iron complex transport system substrate-binding protein
MSSLLPRRHSVRTAVVAFAAAAMATLTACGGGSDSDAGSAPAGSSDSAASGTGAFPATVATKFGDVTVKSRPERVVALGWSDAEVALSLGVQPVGASDWLAFGGEGLGPWVTEKYTTAPEIIGTLEPEYEKIAALKPDLILDVRSSGDQKRYDTLSKIAPTVDVPKDGDNYLTSWTEQTTMIAQALGVPEKGQALIAATEADFTRNASENPEFKGRTITVGSKTSEGYGAYVTGDSRVDIAEKLGFGNNPTIQKQAGDSFSVSVSNENLNQLDADVLVMLPIFIDAKEITGDPLYRAIPAVKAGHDVVIDDTDIGNAFSAATPAATSYALEKVVPLIRTALAK